MTEKILLFLGAGRNVGAASVAYFKKKGYKVASVARSVKPEIEACSDVCLTADFSNPEVMKDVFERVRQAVGTPNIVIYNPFAWSRGPDKENPLSTSVEAFQSDFAVNVASAYAAAKYTIEGFDSLPKDLNKVFMYTGNNGNTGIIPAFLTLGMGKSAAWYIIQQLAATKRFMERNYRFYYVDERTPTGKATLTSGRGHAEFFLELAEKDEQGPTLATFVRGKGYTKFAASEIARLPSISLDDAVDFAYGQQEY
ncbi:hypothetical protein BDV24DRAFT_161948 [Aspergillus arachidicola]|uniref:Short-chain dehydrogenase n=1 Tax=Aspergillus arachidicola TaxID=656916 RepID=A0A5N6YBE0_9EURO|nr:hypothetical protein BDV24DRAFT_161948 [Aspergillus arachidicola]